MKWKIIQKKVNIIVFLILRVCCPLDLIISHLSGSAVSCSSDS